MKRLAWVVPCARKEPFLLVGGTSFLPNALCLRAPTYKQLLSRKTAVIRSTLHQHSEKALPTEPWKGERIDAQILISNVKFNEAGLVPAIAQQWDSGEILMMAWMNADSIAETLRGGRAVYYSRSRQQLWRKGDTSGQIQEVRDVVLDCDGDTILLKVDQFGVACHTGRRSCFYKAFRPPHGEEEVIADVLMDPNELYKNEKQKL